MSTAGFPTEIINMITERIGVVCVVKDLHLVNNFLQTFSES